VNYIAHIHIGQLTDTSMVGNFLGDFVKGSQLESLPRDIEIGIRLHRKVDVFTDQHREVKKLKLLFPPHLQRVAGIALDIYFDHLLLLHWHKFSEQESKTFFNLFYQQLMATELDVGSRFERVKVGMLSHRWLQDYLLEETCLRAMQSVEQRLKGKIVFAEPSYDILNHNKVMIEKVFLRFYVELFQHARLISTKL
jgi:acyl carrier protein phosphodiesterase